MRFLFLIIMMLLVISTNVVANEKQQKGEISNQPNISSKSVDLIGIGGIVVGGFGIAIGILIAIRQSKQARVITELTSKMDRNLTLLDEKVFGSLYTIGDTVRSMLKFIGITESYSHSEESSSCDNDLYIMAYWLWFGIDDQWNTKSDITSIRDSELYKKIVRRIEDHRKRGGDSKTIVIVYDPNEKRSELIDMIKGIIRHKAAKKNWEITDQEIDRYSEDIYLSYSKVLNKMIEQVEKHCGKGDNDEIYFSEKIPNIIFAQKYEGIMKGISFLGEIDFLNQSFKTTKSTSTSVDLEISEFFGFQTHDPQMVASLIKQITVIKDAEYSVLARNRLTRTSSGQ